MSAKSIDAKKVLLDKEENFDALKTACLNYQALGEVSKAVELAISAAQNYPQAAVLLAQLYNSLGEFGKAESCLRQGLTRAPNDAFLNAALANIYACQGKDEKAKSLLQSMSKADKPHHLNWVLGRLYMKGGDIEQGYLLMESRYDDPVYNSKAHLLERIDFKHPLPESTGNILVSKEEGVADQMRLARYLAMLDKGMAERVYVNCDDRLMPLFKNSFPDLKFVSSEELNLEFMKKHQINRQILLGSSWFLAGKPVALAGQGYLKTGGVIEKKYPARPIKIGLCWRSVKLQPARALWYMPLREVAALFADIDCELVSLQNDVSEQELETIREYAGKELQITDVDAKDDFLGLAGLIAGLDLVISTATATSELAGATGQKTWVLGNAHPDRWHLSQKYIDHFYPRLKLYLNTTPTDWSELAAEVRRDLLDFVSQGR